MSVSLKLIYSLYFSGFYMIYLRKLRFNVVFAPRTIYYENSGKASAYMKKKPREHSRAFSRLIKTGVNFFLSSDSLKYCVSSAAAFVIDYILTLLLTSVIKSGLAMEIALAVAWCVSSITNFFVNRSFVFRSNAPLYKALPEYYGLAGVVFILKSLLLELMTRMLDIPLWLSKPVAEVIFFVSNYLIQKKLIFRKKKNHPR